MARTGNCSDHGGLVICLFTFLKVQANRIVRIDKVSCGGPVDAGNVIQFFILSTSPDFDSLEPVAVIPAKQTIDLGGGSLIVANENGPYFFKADEWLYILGERDPQRVHLKRPASAGTGVNREGGERSCASRPTGTLSTIHCAGSVCSLFNVKRAELLPRTRCPCAESPLPPCYLTSKRCFRQWGNNGRLTVVLPKCCY